MSPPEIMFWASCFHWNLKIPYWNCPKTIVFITYSPHCFAQIEASKNNKNQHNQISTDRFTKRPRTQNINISLDRWQIHLWKKENQGFQGPLQETPRNLPGTSRPLPRLFMTLLTSKGPPRTPQDPLDTSHIINFIQRWDPQAPQEDFQGPLWLAVSVAWGPRGAPISWTKIKKGSAHEKEAWNTYMYIYIYE